MQRRRDLSRSARGGLAALLGLVLVAIHRAAGFGESGFARRGDFASSVTGQDFGERADSTGPTLLLDLDWRTPAVTTKPATAAAIAAKLGVTAAHVTEAWLCDEASGSLVGEIAGYTLAEGGVGVAYQRTQVGLFDGTDAHSIKGVELPFGTGSLTDAATSHLDDDGATSRAFLFAFRRYGSSATGTRTLFGKSTVNEHYRLRWNSGTLVFELGDGVATVVAATVNAYDDGAEHYAWCVIDRAANVLRIITERETVTSASIASIGSASNASGFSLGVAGGSPAVQVPYLVALEGSSVEGVTQADCEALWSHATQPTTPVLDTYTRASLACPEVGNEPGFGIRVAKYGSGQFAHGYNSSFSHATKLGALIEAAATNQCLYSEDQSNAAWVATNATKTADQGEAPDGTQTADDITASASAGYVQQAITTVASTEHAQAIYLTRNQGTDVSGRLVMYDISNGAELAATAFTATSLWQRIEVTASTIAGGISTGLRIEITTSGESILVWGAHFAAEPYASSYIPTTSASATRAETDAGLVSPGASTYYKSTAGESETVLAMATDVAGSNRIVFFSASGASLNDRITSHVNLNGTMSHVIYDGVGAPKHSFPSVDPGDWDQEHTLRLRWDAADGVDGNAENADAILDGVRTGGSVQTWVTGSAADELSIGSRDGLSWHTGGVFARMRVWDAPRPEVVA